MTPERWQTVKDVLAAALARAPVDREAFLTEACGTDGELRSEVESLLRNSEEADSFLEPPPARAPTNAMRVLGDALRTSYRLERELGRGGMATVYLAQDLRHDRPVALKLLHPELGAHAGAGRFLREIKLTARLDHPHILPLLDSGETAGLLWYTMPYVPGDTLRARLAREGRLPIEEAVRITREAADALHYAHSQGVVHRDVKPENILVGGGHARVADFGIAKALEVAGGEQLTVSGFLVGTPHYMSPEQAAGAEVDARTDVYALGCVLYEMLAGKPPFTGPTPQAIMGRRFVEAAPPVRMLREEVPNAVEAALTRALAREPAARFQSAAQLEDALAHGSVATATPAPSPTREGAAVPGRPRLRRRLLAGVGSLGVGVLLGLGVLFARRAIDHAADGGAAGPQLLAVLPFENLGDSSLAYLADGISDAVRGKLAGLPGVAVIAGASSSEYRRTTKSPREVARELGVRYLLIGKVHPVVRRGQQGELQVNSELIEIRPRGAPITKWQEPIGAPSSDVFQVEAQIAGGVAEAIGVALDGEDRLRLARAPTANLAAYSAYLRGEQIASGQHDMTPNALRQAVPYFEQAVALDPGFVQAWAQLGRVNASIYGDGGTMSAAQAEAARKAAERALALAPDRPEGRLALGDYYQFVPKDSRRALEQYTLGLKVAPENAELLSSAGVAEQYLGRWDVALEHFRRAAILDPRSKVAARTLLYALLYLHRYSEALAAADRAQALAPADPGFAELKAMVYLAQGDLTAARDVVRGSLQRIDPASLVACFGYFWDLYWVLEGPERQLLLRLPPDAFDNNRASWGLVLAQTYALAGDQPHARAYADSARLAFEQQLREAPQDGQLHVLYGLALAYLGERGAAVREGERGIALFPIREHGSFGAYVQHQLVRIYLLVGEPEKALDRLEPLLKMPYYLSPRWLRIDPAFAVLRGNPRFERLARGS